jgi:hypothetical protein
MKRRLPILFFALSSLAFADLKLTNRMTSGGQTLTSTVLMKDGKVRTETKLSGRSLVGIQDCQHHQIVSMNDATKAFLITDLDESPLTERAARSTPATTIVMKVTEQDTGEHKDFFGHFARHIKGTIDARGGEGACHVDSHASTDGWYIDLPEYESCTPADRQILRDRVLSSSNCSAHITVNSSGVEQPGYPVLVDMTFRGDNGDVTVHQETTELSSSTVEPALFEVPGGYKQVKGYAELMGTSNQLNSPIGMGIQQSGGQNFPPLTGAGPNENGNGVVAGASNTTTEKKKGVLRIGITQLTSSANTGLVLDGLQQELVNDINFVGGQGVIVAADPNDRDATMEQARHQGCDYVVFTNITNFRTASVGQKLGRVFNRGGVGGVGGAEQGRVQIDAEVKIFQPDKDVPVLDGQTNFRGNDADYTAKGLMHTEARTVMLQIKNLQEKK